LADVVDFLDLPVEHTPRLADTEFTPLAPQEVFLLFPLALEQLNTLLLLGVVVAVQTKETAERVVAAGLVGSGLDLFQ
jgi:hypothetical protein